MRPIRLMALALAAATAQAAGAQERDGDFLLRINAPVVIAPGESASVVVVIGDDVTVRGTVREQLIVIGGKASVSGTVSGGVVAVNGGLDLAETARVGGDIYLHRSTLSRASGSAVGGEIQTSRGDGVGRAFGVVAWIGFTLVAIAAGLLFAATAGRALSRAADAIVRQSGATAGATLATWVGIPMLIALSFATVIGIPLGLAMLVFLLPALGFLGFIVSGAALGRTLLRGAEGAGAVDRPYRDVLFGVVALQLMGLIPAVGGLLVLVAAAAGAGALVLRAWTGWRGAGRSAAAPAPPAHAIPAT